MSDVKRPKEFERLMSDLCQSDDRVFNSYKDLLVFAACLGASRNRRKKISKSAEPVGMHIFRGEFDLAVFHILALNSELDPTVMSDESTDLRIKTFEEYAFGGLEIIESEVMNAPQNWDLSIEALMRSCLETKGSLLDDITSLV